MKAEEAAHSPGALSSRTGWLWGLQAALIVLAGWFVFAPSFNGGWLWDDYEIRGNLVLRDWPGLWKIWFVPDTPDYYPLKTSVLWAQWHLWHENLLGYHLTNAALHLLSAFLLWHLLRKLGVRLAWLGGLLFVVHPMMMESVAWVSELKNTLSLPLLLLAMIKWIDWDEGRNGGVPVPGRYWLSLVLFLAAMLAKSSVAMFPFVLLLYAWWRWGRISLADLRAAAFFFAVSLTLGLLTVWFQQHRAIANWRIPRADLAAKVADAGRDIGFYFSKFVFPWKLMPIYPRWNAASPWLVKFLPWLLITAIFAWLWTKRAGFGRHALLGLGWFVINLVPVLGFVPMAYQHVAPVADHLAYVPLVGLAGLAAAGCGAFPVSAFRLPASILGQAAIAAVLLVLAVKSHLYARIFVSQEAMWSYNLRQNSQSPGVYMNLAFIQHQDGQMADAIANYEKAIQLDPEDAQAEDELAGVLNDQSEQAKATAHYEKAIAHYERALQINPTLYGTRRSLARTLDKAGRTADAIAQYQEVLRQDSHDPEIENYLGKALEGEGRRAEAIPHYEKALALEPRYAGAENNLGLALAGEDRPREAIAHLQQALQIEPDFAEAHNNLGFVLAAAGRGPEAIAQFEKALQLKPEFGQAHNNLGFALAAAGRRSDAIIQFEKALQLKPEDAKAHYNLAMILEAAGKTHEAVAHLDEAIRLDPNFAPARSARLRLKMARIAAGSDSP